MKATSLLVFAPLKCLRLYYRMAAQRASILLVYTGGTIGMVENPETGALEPLDFNYLQDNVTELRHLGCDISSVEFQPPLDSSAITTDHWVQLARVIEANYDKYDGFVILHGTDTMAYTASAMSFVFEGLAKPIVFTGSQLPVGKLRTDGKENLIAQLTAPVRWTESVQAMVADGATRFVEVGPGAVLQGLVKKISPAVETEGKQ